MIESEDAYEVWQLNHYLALTPALFEENKKEEENKDENEGIGRK